MKLDQSLRILEMDQMNLITGDELKGFYEFIDNTVESKAEYLILDLRKCWTISVKGLVFVNNLSAYIRQKYLFPIIIANGFLKKILLHSGVDKSIEIYSEIPETIEKNDSVQDLEKNLLWMTNEELDE